MRKIVIIGGVAAGATAAARARRLDGSAEITLLEAGSDVSFANCGLPYYIGGEVANRSSLILASEQTFHDQYRVAVHTNTEALAIDRDAHTVTARNTETGETTTFPYDSLILAQGGKPITPPVPGVEHDHVFQLWTLDDMDRIYAFLEEHAPREAVVVGGGFIGVEMVEALVQRGINVHLVEMAPHVMPAVEGEIAGFLTKEMQDYGVTLHMKRSVTEIQRDEVILDDGTRIPAEFVLVSVGVKPSLAVAAEAGLTMGETGALQVNSQLQTSDPAIYAAGDMVEITHTVLNTPVRIPLAGPANRQGRIVAENALGGSREYKGALGTSIVKFFGAVVASTGLSLARAKQLGLPASAVVTHKLSHTAYYPGAERVTLLLVFDPETGAILGAQAAGRDGVDKRIDVVATAIAGGLTIEDLQEIDLAYAPPFNSPNGPVHMTAFTAQNQRSGFSPAVLAADLEEFVLAREPIAVDLRDPITYRTSYLHGSTNLSHNQLREAMHQIPEDQAVLVISDDGQKGHVAARMLLDRGVKHVFNLSGGAISMERHARAVGYERLQVKLLPNEAKHPHEIEQDETAEAATDAPGSIAGDGPLIIDVRTWEEFDMGAVPGAIHISLDELMEKIAELGDYNREITLYCASGARSAYGQRLLQQAGFVNVRNGGGLHDMLAYQ